MRTYAKEHLEKMTQHLYPEIQKQMGKYEKEGILIHYSKDDFLYDATQAYLLFSVHGRNRFFEGLLDYEETGEVPDFFLNYFEHARYRVSYHLETIIKNYGLGELICTSAEELAQAPNGRVILLSENCARLLYKEDNLLTSLALESGDDELADFNPIRFKIFLKNHFSSDEAAKKYPDTHVFDICGVANKTHVKLDFGNGAVLYGEFYKTKYPLGDCYLLKNAYGCYNERPYAGDTVKLFASDMERVKNPMIEDRNMDYINAFKIVLRAFRKAKAEILNKILPEFFSLLEIPECCPDGFSLKECSYDELFEELRRLPHDFFEETKECIEACTKERFVTREMAQYLEDLGLAVIEPVSREDVER